MSPENVSHLTPVRAVLIAHDTYRFDWPADSPKVETYGEQKHLDRLRKRNAMLGRAPFPVIPLEDL